MLRMVYLASPGVVSHAFSAHVHAMHVFDVRASSSSPRLPLCQISFLSPSPIAELARGEKLDTQSLTQSPSLFVMPRTETYRFGKMTYV